MPSRKTIAATPVATGVLLAGSAAREIVQNGVEIWTTLALAGGLSAFAVGLGILTGLDGFGYGDDSTGYRNRRKVALAGLALTCFAVGAWSALA
jgi:hypothetical protein